jgi:hypothetical protein
MESSSFRFADICGMAGVVCMLWWLHRMQLGINVTGLCILVQ